jgi:hypothetical protein
MSGFEKYWDKVDGSEIFAAQWKYHGHLPEVVGPYQGPSFEGACIQCQMEARDHGTIDPDRSRLTVCPGSFVRMDLYESNGEPYYTVYDFLDFNRRFTMVEPVKGMTSGEKMIWAAAFAEAAQNDNYDIKSRVSACERAQNAVNWSRLIKPHVQAAYGETSEVHDMLCQMLEE